MNDEKIGEMISDIKWIKQKLEGLDNKYASKWIEKPVIGAISLILLSFVGAIVGLIFAPNAHAIAQFYINLIS